MNLHALRLFYVVAETRSVTRAAEILSISQPAITSQIKKFEQELSLPLLKPEGRGIALTDAGEHLAVLAARLFAVEQQIEQYAAEYRDGGRGRLRLAATYLPANFLIPSWIAKYKQHYERVEVKINTTNSSEALKQLLGVEVDLAIYGGLLEEHPDSIYAEELFQDELWFVVAPSHPYANQEVTLEEMAKIPFVMREEELDERTTLITLSNVQCTRSFHLSYVQRIT